MYAISRKSLLAPRTRRNRHSVSERHPWRSPHRPRLRGRFFVASLPAPEAEIGQTHMAHRVGIIGGDGIGPEVTAEALKVVRAAGVDLDTTDYDLGGRRYLATGDVLPDPVLDELRGYDAILLGAVGTPEVPPGVPERGLLLKMRFAL